MIATMPRDRTQPSMSDLFSAVAQDALLTPTNQVPTPKAAVDKAADTSLRRYVLEDLSHALKQLDDSELVSLLGAAFEEAKRRDKLRPGLVANELEGRDLTAKGSPKSNQRSEAHRGHSAALSLTRGQVNDGGLTPTDPIQSILSVAQPAMSIVS
jgi:hypothetical protein